MNSLWEPGAGPFRQMLFADLREIALIERRAYAFCWTEGVFRDCIRADYFCRVLQEVPHGPIQGYGILSAAAGEAHILNLCAGGITGARTGAANTGSSAGAGSFGSDPDRVSGSSPLNHRAVRLYSAAGFCEIGLRIGYYPATKGKEDALIMAKELPVCRKRFGA